jgi:preprotein translocase subunit SecA
MRIFGSEKMEALLGNQTFGLRDGEALTHPWISKALERAQAKVEAMNFDIRKNLLKFDNVMNDQRKVIYEQRKDIMTSEDVSELVKDMRHNVIEDLVARTIPARSYADQWDTETLKNEALRLLNISIPAPDWGREEGIAEEQIYDRIIDASDAMMDEKIGRIGAGVFLRLEKALLLQKLDQHWKEHLLNLDHLRQGINLRAFGQRDPLNEYRTEAFAMFEMMLHHLRESVTQVLALVEFNPQAGAEPLPRREAPAGLRETRQDPALAGQPSGPVAFPQAGNGDNVEQMPIRNPKFDARNPATWGQVPRNAACPCGSGKKFKHCHGRIVE